MSSQAFNVTSSSLLIRAGAGAGKTTTLIQTFVDLCHQFEIENKRLPKVAITTFTRKATQEVKERLSVKALQKNDEILFQHINKKSHVHISTIHGLLTLFVQENADILGLPQSVKIVDENIYKKFLKKTIRNYLRDNPKFLEILEHYSFSKLVDFVAKGIEAIKQNPDIQILNKKELQQFTDNRIDELNHLLLNILESAIDYPETWNAYFDYLKSFQKLFQNKLITEIIQFSEEGPAKPRWNKKNPAFDSEIHENIELFWKQYDLSVADTPEYFENYQNLNNLFIQLIQDISKIDQQQKSDSGEITINDLELFSLQLVRQYPDRATYFSDHFDYYMIDEYQDTSPIQVEILDAIIANKPHFIVGDPQQSIYLFRGARSEVFLNKQEFASQNQNKMSLKILDTNYRSQPSLMHFINEYFRQVSGQFQPMQVNPFKEENLSDIYFIQSENEAQAALVQIQRLIQQKVSPKDICVLSRRNYNLVKIADLAHKNHIPIQLQVSAGFDQKREVLDLVALLKFLINPHDNENLITLLRSPWAYLADDIIAKIAEFMKAENIRSIWLALNSERFDLKEVTTPVLNSLNNFIDQYQKNGTSEAFIQFVKQSGFLSLSSAYDSSGKREANFWKFYFCLKQAENLPGFALNQFISENFQFFQSDLGSSQSEAIPVSQPDRVSLMTIHASKGLEFKHVIVMGFSEQPLITLYQPLSVDFAQNKLSLAPFILDESKSVVCRWAQKNRQDFNLKEYEEHERMLYVALTRAKESLTLIAEAKSRQSAQSWQKKSFWPEVGVTELPQYRMHSILCSSEIEAKQLQKEVQQPVRNKLKFSTQSIEKSSVTDSISIINSFASQNQKNESEILDQKILDLFKAKKGTDLHRVFESLQLFSEDSEKIQTLQKYLSKDEQLAVQYLLSQEILPLKDLIRSGFPEWGFGLKTKKGILQGQIDLWGQIDQDVYILDYKTGRSHYFDKALKQLNFYAECLYKMNLIKSSVRLHLGVIYPLENKTLIRSFMSEQDFRNQLAPEISSLF